MSQTQNPPSGNTSKSAADMLIFNRHATPQTKRCITEGCDSLVSTTQIEPGVHSFFTGYCEGCIQKIKAEETAAATIKRRKQRQKIELARFMEAWGGERSGYHRTDFNSLPYPAISQKVLNWKPQKDGKGLLLVGPTGSGKSRTVYILLAGLLNRHIFADIRPCVKLRHEIAKAAKSKFDTDREQLIGSMIEAPILYLDDLGQMSATDSAAEALLEIIEGRTIAGLPIIASTQFTGERFVGTFRHKETGQAIARRLFDFCEIHEFPTKQ
jgi:DNA replication protein DnaC